MEGEALLPTQGRNRNTCRLDSAVQAQSTDDEVVLASSNVLAEAGIAGKAPLFLASSVPSANGTVLTSKRTLSLGLVTNLVGPPSRKRRLEGVMCILLGLAR